MSEWTQDFTGQQKARAVVSDGQGITVLAIAQLKLPLVVSTPKSIG